MTIKSKSNVQINPNIPSINGNGKKEKRKYIRIQTNSPIRLYYDYENNCYNEHYGDLSLSGCKTYSFKPFGLKSEVKIGLTLPGNEVIIVNGTVVRELKKQKKENSKNDYNKFLCKECNWEGFWSYYGESAIRLHALSDKQNLSNKNFTVKVNEGNFNKKSVPCPNCGSILIVYYSSFFYELGIKFNDCNKQDKEAIRSIIRRAVELEEKVLLNDSLTKELEAEAKNNWKTYSKRAYERVDANFMGVQIETIFNKSYKVYNSLLKNISLGGIYLISDLEFSINQKLNVILGLENTKKRLKIECRIAHKTVQVVNEKNQYGYGVQFCNFDYDLKEQVRDFIRKMLP